MEENMKVDKMFLKAFNLGYEVAKELDLKTHMFQNEGSDITLKSPIQAGMFRFVQERYAVIDKKLNNNNLLSTRKTIKKTFGKNKNKGLTP